MTSPAQTVIQKCGGFDAVAKMLGVHKSRVHRWTYPRERGGTGGYIPTRHQNSLMDAARAKGISLDPADFFDAQGVPQPERDERAA